MEDRRRSERRRTRARALLNLGGDVVEGVMLDLSETGAWLALPTSARAGYSIVLTFEHPGTGEKVNSAAVVSRCVRLDIADMPPFGVGLEFDGPLTMFFEERAERVTVDPVPVLVSGADAVMVRGVLVNVSASGLLVVGASPRERYDELRVSLKPTASDPCPEVQLVASVQWVRPRDRSGFIASGLAVRSFPTREDRVAFANWVASLVCR